jgi:hypothetical protein
VKVLRAVIARRRGGQRALRCCVKPSDWRHGGASAPARRYPSARHADDGRAASDGGRAAIADACGTPDLRRPSQQADLLTYKEAAILDLLDKGLPNKLIARTSTSAAKPSNGT